MQYTIFAQRMYKVYSAALQGCHRFSMWKIVALREKNSSINSLPTTILVAYYNKKFNDLIQTVALILLIIIILLL